MTLTYTGTPPSLSRVVSPPTVSDACAAVLLLSVQLRSAHEFGDSATLRRRTDELIDQTAQHLRAADFTEAEAQDVLFALVAFVDESISRSEWPQKGDWLARPVQFDRFQCYDAGDQFFVRLQRLLDDRNARNDVLQIYYYCLTLGFKGQYLMSPEAAWKELVRKVGQQLADRVAASASPLSPHGVADETLANAVKRMPVWVLLAAGGLLAFLFYLVLTVVISWRAGNVQDLVRPSN